MCVRSVAYCYNLHVVNDVFIKHNTATCAMVYCSYELHLAAGLSFQIITSSLGLIMALLGFVFAMAECWKHKDTVMRCWRHREHAMHYEDFLAVAVFSNFISYQQLYFIGHSFGNRDTAILPPLCYIPSMAIWCCLSDDSKTINRCAETCKEATQDSIVIALLMTFIDNCAHIALSVSVV